jgi:uncharacterized damage-inducible protein DinB
MVDSAFPKERVMSSAVRVAFAALVVVSCSTAASAQTAADTRAGIKGTYDIVKGNLLKSAEMATDEIYAFKPTPDVRSTGQLLGHVANANYMICSMAAGEKSPATSNAEQLTAKADIQKALAGSFAYCDTVWTKIEGDKGSEAVDVFGMKHTRASAMAFNAAHDWEHYGNIVTYLRLKGLVPPSSQRGGGN